MQQIGYIITHTDGRYGARIFYHIRLCYLLGGTALQFGERLNIKVHYISYIAAKQYAEKWFLHSRMTEPWIYLGDMTNLSHIDHLQWHKRRVNVGRWYKSGRYFTLSKTRETKARKKRTRRVEIRNVN